ncbi:MAG TPA: DNA translocase FtsK [Patescibacteria group bacterium]|nr:DNA translocase FtsK [Patescibacteria group bacterium]
MRRYKRRSQVSPIHLEKKTITSIIGIFFLAFAVLLAISFFTSTGALLSLREYFYYLFGLGVALVPIYSVFAGLLLLSVKIKFAKINVIFGSIAAIFAALGLLAPFSSSSSGIFGEALWLFAKSTVTVPGAFFVLFCLFLVSAIIAANTSLDQALASIVKFFKAIGAFFKNLKAKFTPARRPKIIEHPQLVNAGAQKLQQENGLAGELSSNLVLSTPTEGKIWQYPPLSLLADSKGIPANRGNIKQNARTIEELLESFGITAKVVEVNPGPTVTQYALEIPRGIRLSKILTLQNDLALALATTTGNVRIEAPIPGKSLVGIEIPNISPEMVTLKSTLSSEVLRTNKQKIAVGLGLDVSGNIIVADISRMPHVLIAGTTGSGKSVLLNSLIATILFRASPDEVKLILADPKRVELSEYNGIPHLLTPVIIEPDKILSSLKWAISEMERRYKLFHDAQVKNIAGYNEFSGIQVLPYIVIIIDELYKIMEFAPVEVEDAITRLAAMARATGIHLVLATQRPSVDVITGLIKANIPCRIAFNVSSMIDSRVILDQPGAEKLLGRGDMLYVPPDASKPQRIQGVYVSDTEVRNLIEFMKTSGFEPHYTEEVTQIPVGRAALGKAGAQDELFEEALRIVCQYDRASASLLQRKLRVGYARAARLIDELEMAGIVGPGDRSKPRDVLIKNAEDYLAAQEVEPGQNP